MQCFYFGFENKYEKIGEKSSIFFAPFGRKILSVEHFVQHITIFFWGIQILDLWNTYDFFS